jgi:uncharacterized protein YhdP
MRIVRIEERGDESQAELKGAERHMQLTLAAGLMSLPRRVRAQKATSASRYLPTDWFHTGKEKCPLKSHHSTKGRKSPGFDR